MRITLVGRGMPMRANVLQYAGLGGSETAQLCVGEELARQGHLVTQFCEMDPVWPAHKSPAGVRWRRFDELRHQERPHECDLLIVCRRPDLIEQSWIRSDKRVLWVQDFAAGAYPSRPELGHYDEIWFVSEWQQAQWYATLRFEMSRVLGTWVTRNGIAPVTLGSVHQSSRHPRQLMFASRPERGLVPLVRPGGIMDQLPEFNLVVCGYADFPAEHAAFYEQVRKWCDERDNVQYLGSLPNEDVRALLAESAALVMPTDYAETSCMVALEAIEQLCHVFTTPLNHTPGSTQGCGALTETLGQCGKTVSEVMVENWNSDLFCAMWANSIRASLKNHDWCVMDRMRMMRRTDLWWPVIAREWTHHAMTMGVK